MLIQITNKCHEGCAHCMQCSNPHGEHMDMTNFKNALRFARFLGVSSYIITGGEPTEHPQFYEFCEALNRFIKGSKVVGGFSITSNGTWFPERKAEMEELAKLDHYVGMQVYTNPKWYKDTSFILEHKDEIDAIPKVFVDTHEIQSMQDLGRAKTNEQAQIEVANNRYHMSCLNGHLLFKQTSSTRKLTGLDRQPGVMCKPCVDYKGNVHLSESHLCQSFGNVNENYWLEIFNNLRNSKPCCKCALGQKFLKSTDIKIVVAKNLLGFNE